MDELPVFDLFELESLSSGSQERLSEFQKACREWGFFHLSGSGLSSQKIEEFRAQQKYFFALPKEKKLTIKRTEANSRGYFDDELTKQKLDQKECFDVGREGIVSTIDGFNQWPEGEDQFRKVIVNWMEEMEKLSFRILRVLCRALGIEETDLDDAFADHTSFLRLNYYPSFAPSQADSKVTPDSESYTTNVPLGISPHKDAGVLTILLQDPSVYSLQVWHLNRWCTVIPKEVDGLPTFTVNVGDMFQVFSNNKFVAVEHRVLTNSKAERSSAPYFFNPSFSCDVAPLPSLTVSSPALYRPINWGEFRRKRFAGDYADSGEENQIHHYLLN